MTHIIGITDFTLVLTRNFAIANRSCISGAYTVMIVNFQGGGSQGRKHMGHRYFSWDSSL